MILRLMFVIVFFSPAIALANISGELTQFYDALHMNSNITKPQAYRGQQAGYYTGGNVFARANIKNVKLMDFQFPTLKTGCGGIDLFTGSFSYINTDEFKHLANNIMSNAKAYAFNIALETTSPMISNVVNKLQQKIETLNLNNINTCQTAASMVGSVWPRTEIASKQICQDIGTSSGIGMFSDWAAARHGCADSATRQKSFKNASGDQRFEHRLFDGNLAWKVAQATFGSTDLPFNELLISLTGTMIFDLSTENSRSPQAIYPPLLTSNNLLDALLHGGETYLYRCQGASSDCRHIKKEKVTISGNKALVTYVQGKLDTMLDAIEHDEPLSPALVALVSNTQLPLYKMLMTEYRLKQKSALVDTHRYAELLAFDVLMRFLKRHIAAIDYGYHQYDYPTEILSTLLNWAKDARTALQDYHDTSLHRMQLYQTLIKDSRYYEGFATSRMVEQLAHHITRP